MPDLKKMLTLEALSEALPSWLKRSTKPEYNADEIDSTLTTNQFVTASDKANWNAKGTYSKPNDGIPKSDLSSIVQTSLEKADSALQNETDPTVPSWAKQSSKPSYTQDEVSDGTTYKRVTQNEKDAWSGKQNALTTTQMNAVNSGITSAGVAQISTNQANVSYAINTGAWNLCPAFLTKATKDGVTLTSDSTGVHITGTQGQHTDGSSDVTQFLLVDEKSTLKAGTYVFSGTASDAGYSQHRIHFVFEDGTYVMLDTANPVTQTFSTDKVLTRIYIYLRYPVGTVYNLNLTPMVVDKSIWDTLGHDYHEPSLQNFNLTRLESEDRAALAEVVDSSAKNLASVSTITRSGQGSSADNIPISLKPGAYAVSYDYTASSGAVQLYFTGGGYTHECTSKTGTGHYEEIITVSSDANTYYRTYTSGGNSTVSNIMICTLADWKVSQKFVTYRGITQFHPVANIIAAITSSDTLADTGVSYTLKPNTFYRVTGWARYNTKNPEEVAITINGNAIVHTVHSSTTTNPSISATSVYLSGGGAGTIVLQAKYNSAAAGQQVGLLVEELS